MMREYNFYVYIMASCSGTLYIGVTNNLERHVSEHRQGRFEGFAKKYSCTRLVYCEHHRDVLHAIAREKQLKKWRREKKEKLIRMKNPPWKDLSADWFGDNKERE
jgi:putative endonuclease